MVKKRGVDQAKANLHIRNVGTFWMNVYKYISCISLGLLIMPITFKIVEFILVTIATLIPSQ